MEGDPAIRWQVMRDLEGRAEGTVRREQARVATSGWGRRLLELQNPDGRWAGGLYTPKWTSTTYTLLLLRSFGLQAGNAQAQRGCRILLDGGCYSDGGINFYAPRHARSETCITSMVLSVASWFGLDDPRLDRLAHYLFANQMADGGWNCRYRPGDTRVTHSSFHTTISALEALSDYQELRPEGAGQVAAARARALEFLLVHRLFRSHRTGAIAKPAFLRFSFPPRWHFDVLRVLDHFACTERPRDPRMQDGIDLVRQKQREDGRWLLESPHAGKTFFSLEGVGQPSRWNTLRAMRVLRWWESV